MSLILDALRKMEHDRKRRHRGLVDIRPDVINYQRSSPQIKPRKIFIPVVAVIVMVVVGFCGWLLLQKITHPIVNYPSTQEAQTISPTESRSHNPLPQQSLPTPAHESPEPGRAESTPPPLPQSTAVNVTSEEPTAAAGVPSGHPTMNISGIAWQDERSLRRAVINGTLVGEGAEVAGARVVEIKQNRVLFSKDGNTFEVAYSSVFSNK